MVEPAEDGGRVSCTAKGGSSPVRAYDRRPPEPDRPIGFRVERQRHTDGLARKRTEIDRSAFPAVHRRQRLLEHGFRLQSRSGAHPHETSARRLRSSRATGRATGASRAWRRTTASPATGPQAFPGRPPRAPASRCRTGMLARCSLRKMTRTDSISKSAPASFVGTTITWRMLDAATGVGAGQRVGLQLVSGHDRRLDPEGGGGELQGQLGQVSPPRRAGWPPGGGCRQIRAGEPRSRGSSSGASRPVCALDAQHRCAARCPPDQTAVADREVRDTRTPPRTHQSRQTAPHPASTRRTATRSAGGLGVTSAPPDTASG